MSFLEQRHPVGSGVLRRLIGFPTGRWFVKPGRGSVLTKRAKTNHEYTFLCSEPQIFTDVSENKVEAIFFASGYLFWLSESSCKSLSTNEFALIFSHKHHHFFVPAHKSPDLNSSLILFLNSSKSELNGRINSSLFLRRECAESIHKSSLPTPFKGHSPFRAQADANAFFELDSRIVCFFAYMVSDQARFIRTNDLFSLAFFDFYPQNATGRGLFLRVHAPQTFS